MSGSAKGTGDTAVNRTGSALGCLGSIPGHHSQGATDIVGWVILHCGHCSVHCRMSDSVADLYLPGASSPLTPLQLEATKNVFRHCQLSLGGNHP